MSIKVYLNPVVRPSSKGRLFNKVMPWGLYRAPKVIAKSSKNGKVEVGSFKTFGRPLITGYDKKGEWRNLYLKWKLLGWRLENSGIKKVVFSEKIASSTARRLFKLLLRGNLESLFEDKTLVDNGIELYFGEGQICDERLSLTDILPLSELRTRYPQEMTPEVIARNLFFNFPPDLKRVVPATKIYHEEVGREEVLKPEKTYWSFSMERLNVVKEVLDDCGVNHGEVIKLLKNLESSIVNPFFLTYQRAYYEEYVEELSKRLNDYIEEIDKKALIAKLAKMGGISEKFAKQLIDEGLVDLNIENGKEENFGNFLRLLEYDYKTGFSDPIEVKTIYFDKLREKDFSGVEIVATEAFLYKNRHLLLEDRIVEVVPMRNKLPRTFRLPSPLIPGDTYLVRNPVNEEEIRNGIYDAVYPALEKGTFLKDIEFKKELRFSALWVDTVSIKGCIIDPKRLLLSMRRITVDGKDLDLKALNFRYFYFDVKADEIRRIDDPEDLELLKNRLVFHVSFYPELIVRKTKKGEIDMYFSDFDD